MTSWRSIYLNPKINRGVRVDVNLSLTSPMIAYRISASNKKLDWYKAGYIYPIFDIPSIGKFQGKSRKLLIGSHILEFEKILTPYKIQLEIEHWLDNVSVQIWEYVP